MCVASNASSTAAGTLFQAAKLVAEVKNVASTDAVTITLGPLGTLAATSTGTLGPNGGYLFTATWAAGQNIGTTSKVSVSASATRSADGQTTAAFSQLLSVTAVKLATSC